MRGEYFTPHTIGKGIIMMKYYKREVVINTMNANTYEIKQRFCPAFDKADEVLNAVYAYVEAELQRAIVNVIAIRRARNPYGGGDIKIARTYDETELNELINLSLYYVEENSFNFDEFQDALAQVDCYATTSELRDFVDALDELK